MTGSIARINRAILLVRSGDATGGKTALTDWLGRAPFPALFGRAHAALAAANVTAGDVSGAQKELALAKKEGLAAFASVGAGVLALGQKRWDEAVKRFEEARDAGTPDIVAAADYGIAVAAFARGKTADFKKPAVAALAATPSGPRGGERAGALLYVLTHEPEVIAPRLAFAQMDLVLRTASAFATPWLARHLDDEEAARLAEWVTRILISYASMPAEGVDIADEESIRRLVRTYVLPGLHQTEQKEQGEL